MKHFILIIVLFQFAFSRESPERPVPPSKSQVFSSLRKSLLNSIDNEKQNHIISSYLSSSNIEKLETFVRNTDLVKNFEGVRNLKERNIQEMSIIDFMENVLKAIVEILELNLKEAFIAMMEPLMELTLLLNPLPEYLETFEIMDGDQPMRYIEETFDNWGSTLLANVTVRTFFPRSVNGIQNVIRNASSIGARVRASATRHTFNPWLWGVESNIQPGTQGQNVDYIIAMLPLSVSDRFAYKRDHGTWPEDSELVNIEGPLNTWVAEDGRQRSAVKFGAGTLNLHYYNWALANNWTMPSNTIMHYMSIGGVAMGTCHGGGIGHKTIADRIIEMDYVDSEGELQTINDPELLKIAAGSMGLLGIVTSITYELDQMSYARYQPQHSDLASTLPPPGKEISDETKKMFENYYSEFIHYLSPGNNSEPGLLWLMTFDNDGKAEDSTQIIDQLENDFQEAMIFGEEVAKTLLQLLMEYFNSEDYEYWLFGWLTGSAARMAMPNLDTPITTTVTEAMHFQRGLHYLIVKAAELIVPLPLLEDGSYDWRIVQEVVYDIKRVHDDFVSRGLHPVDYAFEARIMAGSDIKMSAQYGNQASLAIEVASSDLVPQHIWDEFKNALANNWRSYKDKDGNVLNVRPHWAKEFPLEVGGQDIYDYMRESYKDQIPMFVEGVNSIMSRHNGNLTNTLNMFSTKYLDTIFDGYF